ncbi:serine/threonine-protein kinase [Planctellipticum variicoloris]|uniref:serine/threonine-protein kinase n=1 Tax=Planctellipticum variicoloris TaxID=3064265 RepID=UPI003013660B|nr:protein kinase [Planctomycetaceae bacterium SH412]
MIPQPPVCSAELLDRCLHDALTPAEEQQLEQHLSICATCRDELERLAAPPQNWSTAGAWLRELPSQSPPHSAASVPPVIADPQVFQASDFIVDVLLPAQTEGAIGRLDDLEIQEVIGHGAMGVVLKGWQPELQRLVAVKVLRPDLCGSGAARKRFIREARAAAAVVHPHVMPIHAVRAEGRLPYLVMPYLACESLQHQLDRDGPFELVDVLRIGVQAAQALDAAHAQGLVHRDVKPANILVEKAGQRVLLADFGLARAVDDASVTQSGQVAGTPQYMSPEQARGDRIDHRSDLFSLGSVLYALWTGRPPFRAETAFGVLRRLCEHSPRPMDDIRPETPDWFASVVERLHEKSPSFRLQSAAEAADLLEQCLRHVQQPSDYALPAELLDDVNDEATSLRSLWPVFLVSGGVFMVSMTALAVGLLMSGLLGAPQPQPDVAAKAEAAPNESDRGPRLVAEADEAANEAKDEIDAKYGSAEEAMRVGNAYYSLKEYAKTREPFEAALKLAPDDEYRVKVYRALLAAYRQDSNWLPCAAALEFIIARSKQAAERSLARTELMGFLRARGKTNDATKRYEERLKLSPNDEATIYILIEVYSRLKDDPRRAAVLLEQWSELKKKSGEEMKVSEAAQLAGEYVKQKKFKQAAELYEATAPRDTSLAAWHLKEAATAWLKAGDKERALASAKASEAADPEQRGELLEHFWHRGLADVFFDCGDFVLAIPQYEQAIAKTNIEAYRKDCEMRLAEAKAKVGK